MTEIVDKVKSFVEEECKKPSAKYPTAFKFHFISMVNLSNQLAREMNNKQEVDFEIVELAAWLHDIGSIIYGRKNHHITSTKVAEKKLRELNYPEEKINRVKLCILNHRGSREQENKRDSIEEKIIAEADAMDAFNNLTKQFLVTLVHEGLELNEARKSVKEKLQRKWNQLELKESKKLIKPKYDAAMLLLGDENENRN